jgi:hypothetical protein
MTPADLIDKLMQAFTAEKFTGEVQDARRDFYERAGVFDQASDDFEMKMAQFADWYLFCRPLQQLAKAPIQAMELVQVEFTPEQMPLFEGLKNSRHSLFEFIKIKGSDIFVKDLFLSEKLVIKNSPYSMGFNKAELFEARLAPIDGTYHFCPAFCFHPDQASKYILKEIKRVKKVKVAETKALEKESVISKLFKMKYKQQQYKHVKVLDIYSNEPKLRF